MFTMSRDVPNVTEMYPSFESGGEMNLGAATSVKEVAVGYKVGLDISMPAKLAERVKELLSKAVSSGGGASFFGYDIGFSSGSTVGQSIIENSTSTSISIPGRDLGYPVLLGVKGGKLPAVKISRA